MLVGFGLWRLLSTRHFRWVGMRLSLPQLAGWSFLMSSAHGAGLMLLPVLVTGAGAPPRAPAAATASALGGLAAAGAAHAGDVRRGRARSPCWSTRSSGVGMLRRAWFNLDRMWAVALVAAGVATVVQAA